MMDPMSAECHKGIQPQPDAGVESPDPLAVFIADPESHLSDILYLYFAAAGPNLRWRWPHILH
jgi:hypothetical protein